MKEIIRFLARSILYLLGTIGVVVCMPVVLAMVVLLIPCYFLAQLYIAVEWTMIGDLVRYRNDYDPYGIQLAQWAWGIPSKAEWLELQRELNKE